MNNPVVLITGGLTGIGRAAAVAFAKRGARVVVAGRRDEAGNALVKELRSLGSEAEFINTDVRCFRRCAKGATSSSPPRSPPAPRLAPCMPTPRPRARSTRW
jgi:NAD(P)-dependent dehydrogenase (short-subunit alcohol dehydrogenase family)